MRPLVALAVTVVGLSAVSVAPALEIAEVRGDFYYDSNGQLVGHRNAELPDAERRPMSHREKFERMGLQLPLAARSIEPRQIFPKPERVDDRPELSRDKIIVKFVDDAPVRLRSGELRWGSANLFEVDSALEKYPEASVQRLFKTEERILDEDKETGELLSGRELADLNNFYLVTFDDASERAVALANELLRLDVVETAYLQAPSMPACVDIAPTTPHWTSTQNYLDAAPTGIDADYAKSYHAGGDGYGPSYWIADLEWEWCYDHEDLDIDIGDVLNGSTGSNTKRMNHGTAVLGEIAACDNGFGMTGITPDVRLRMFDFDSDGNVPSVTINAASSQLLAGEIMLLEIQSLGADPGFGCNPSCTLCPPDPDSQFRYVPVEVDPASFAAIQNATANGIIVVEAAGNGSMDLDHPIYSGWFAPSHDSGAIIVGAAVNSTHDVQCWSNAGATVDVHAYGNGVRTTGYGFLWSQPGCEQDYTSSFGGTSAASPIVVGAASALQGIARLKYDVTLSPLEMRSALRAGGTPQGAPTSRNIGLMPNLVEAINWIEPDVEPHALSGWDYSVVPRAFTNSTSGFAPLDAPALPGNVAGTYWNFAMRNAPYAYTPTVNAPDDRVYVDDSWDAQGLRPDHGPGEATFVANLGPRTIKGGRHTIRHFVDFDDVEDEWWEGNNEFARQFIWSPYVLSPGVEVARSYSPPAVSADYGPWYNAEGFRGTTGSSYWHAFAVMPSGTSDDFDIRLNTEAPSNVPQAGFGAYVESSFSGPGEIAFVGLNRNEVASGDYYASVFNFAGAGNKNVVFAEDQGTLSTGTTGPFTIGPGELLNVHEVWLPGGSEYRIHIEQTGGAADFGMSVYEGTTTYFDKTTTMTNGYANDHGPFEDEYVVIDVPVGDYHGLVVWKPDAVELPSSVTYNVIVDVLPNLIAAAPYGWHGPIVPRNTTDAVSGWVPLPPTLTGNETTTSFNWSTRNEGANDVSGTWETHLFVDDFWSWIGYGGTLNSGSYLEVRNTSQGFDPYSLVRGGRHHVRTSADAIGDVTEFSETDNDYTEWFVWTPLNLADRTPVVREAPPERDPEGFGPFYSSDGFRAEWASAGMYWTVVAATPESSDDAYDMRLFQPSTGSKDGFGSYEEWVFDGAGKTVFAVVNYNSGPFIDMDYGVINASGTTGDYVIQRADAPFLAEVEGGVQELGPFTLDANEIVDVREVLVGLEWIGTPIYISVDNVSGNADLGVALFDESETYYGKFDSPLMANGTGPRGDEHVAAFTPGTSGFIGLVVYKDGSTDVPLTSEYRIVISTGASIVDAPEGVDAPASFALSAPRPNPVRGETSIRYDVPATGGAVSLDVFDVNGRRVANLVDGIQPAGRHTARWNGTDSGGRRVVAGVYFVRLEAAGTRETRKLTLLR